MGNHFHLVVRMYPEKKLTDKEIKKRYALQYGKEKKISDGQIPYLFCFKTRCFAAG